MKNGFFSVGCSLLLLLVVCLSAVNAQQPVGTPQVVPVLPQPNMPYPFQGAQSQAELDYINKVLDFWQFRSNKVVQYESDFQRWDYDSVFCPDPNAHFTYGEGKLKYENPDKGLFKVENLRYYTPPKQAGTPPTYETRAGEVLEHWVSNGKSIFQFDSRKKQLIENQLPPDQQGQAIANGPLPFLFGANAAKIKHRFWLKVVTPDNIKNEYWLQAWPKFAEDAAEFKYIEIILDNKEFLPVAIQKYDPRYNPNSVPPVLKRSVYQFANRTVYEQGDLALKAQQLNLFRQAFYEPSVPTGWQKVVNGAQQANRGGQPLGLAPRQR